MRLLQVCKLVLLLSVGADLSDPGTPGVFFLEREGLFQQAVTRPGHWDGAREQARDAPLAVALPHGVTVGDRSGTGAGLAGAPARVTPAWTGCSVRSARRGLTAAVAAVPDLEDQ